jgi:hypothetical protein
MLLSENTNLKRIETQGVLGGPRIFLKQVVFEQSPDQAIGLTLAVSEPFGYFGDSVQRAGRVIKEKDLQTVGKGLINGGCHLLEMGFQYMKISLTGGNPQVKGKIFTKS